MYADQGYHARSPRGASLGAAFLLNGALIAGVFTLVAPVIVPRDPPTTLEGWNIPVPPEPIDPPKVEKRVETEPVRQAPTPTAPDPVVETRTASTFEASTVISDALPPLPPLPSGPAGTATAEPQPPALPPLVAARADPRYAADFQPAYPPSELRAGRIGEVVVRVRIGVDGRVKAVEQVSATSPAFFEATRRQALAKWRFKPATRGDVPEESWRRMSVRFEIGNP